MTDTTTAAADPAGPKPVGMTAPPRWGTVEAALAEFRRRRDAVPERIDASALFRDGLLRGWAAVIEIAEDIARRTRPSEVHAAAALADAVNAAQERIRGVGVTGPSPAAQPEIRQGREDVYRTAVRICGRTLVVAKEHEQEDRARSAALARQAWEDDDCSDWTGYPLVPMDGDEQVDDFGHLAMFLGGDGTSFTGDLLRLIAKADPANLNRLARVYPRHVRAFLIWRACAPIPVRSLVALLNATTMINERKL